MKKSVLKDKSFRFAIRVVKLHKYLQDEKKEFESINVDATEIIKLITSSIKTAKKKTTKYQPLITNH